MLGMIAILIFGGMRNFSPYMLMMPLMVVMGAVGLMAGGGSGGKKVPEINADRKEYLRYLAGLRTAGDVLGGSPGDVLQLSRAAPRRPVVDHRHPPAVPRHQSRLLRRHQDRAGLRTRRRPVAQTRGGCRTGRTRGRAAVPPELVSHMWVTKFLRTHGLIHDCPKLVQLKTFPTIAVGGDLDGATQAADRHDLPPRGGSIRRTCCRSAC